MALAYSATGAAWEAGPGRIYDVLSDVLAQHSLIDLRGRIVLDLGAGTGAASRALARAGAHPVALDAAEGMLRSDAAKRPPAIVADALVLPVRDHAVDGLIAAFSLNHLVDPSAALREARRVTRPGGIVIAGTYASDDTHPVKAAVEQAAVESGWVKPTWYDQLRTEAMPRLATIERAEAALASADLHGEAIHHREAFPQLGPVDLVAWRLGMPQLAPFVANLETKALTRLSERALALLGANPPELVRSLIIIAAVVP